MRIAKFGTTILVYILLIFVPRFTLSEMFETPEPESFTAAFQQNEDELEFDEIDGYCIEPYIPSSVENKQIIGKDNRTAVKNPNKYPYSAIAYMEIERNCGCGEASGTGFLIGPDVLLTAAHCMICKEHGAPPKSVTIYFGYKSHRNYAYKYTKGATFWYGTDFQGNEIYHSDWDYAYLKLRERIGDEVGWFGIAARNDNEIAERTYEIAGYPSGKLMSGTGVVEAYGCYEVVTDIDTVPGNSGSPIFDEAYYVVGILTHHSKLDKGVNFRRRISNNLLIDMNQNHIFD